MDQSPVEGPHPDPIGNALTVVGQKVPEVAAVAAIAGQVRAQNRATKQAVAAEKAEADLAKARTEAVLRGGVPQEAAARVAEGLAAGYSASLAGAGPAQPTVSAYGPGAANWPSSVHQAVGAAVLGQAAGRRRLVARRAGTVHTQARRASLAP